MDFNILCVSPYQGLNILMKDAVNQLPIADDHYHFDFLRFDRGDPLKALNDALDEHAYDLLISRGGTSSLLQQETALPVIDIGVSQIDLVNVIHSVEHIDSVALVAFPAIAQKANEIITRYNLSLPVYTIQPDENLDALFLQLRQHKTDTIISDTTTESLARDAGFTTLLITASKESIGNALNRAIQLLQEQKQNLALIRTLNTYMNNEKLNFLVLDPQGSPLFTSGFLQGHPNVIHQIITAWRRRHKRVNIEDRTFRLESLTGNAGQIILAVHEQLISQAQTPIMDIDNPNVRTAFAQYFKYTQKPQFFNLVAAYAKENRPIVILGKFGTGKMYVANLLEQAGHFPTDSLVYLDPTKTKEVQSLLHDERSVLYSSERIIVITRLNLATPTLQSEITDFINESHLAGRNQIIITLETDPNRTLNRPLQELISHANLLTLPALKEVTGDVLSKILTTLINTQNRNQGSNIIGFTNMTLDFLLQEDWRDNFAQFYEVVAIAIASTTSDYIEVHDLEFALQQYQQRHALQQPIVSKAKNTISVPSEKLSDVIHATVVQALDENHGHKAQTAEQLGISRATLWRYLKQA
jgi:sugar diacid utilization regulator